ncbi:MAG: hypothetical protein ACLUHG_03310, partial [Sutterella wadsworthensis]
MSERTAGRYVFPIPFRCVLTPEKVHCDDQENEPITHTTLIMLAQQKEALTSLISAALETLGVTGVTVIL